MITWRARVYKLRDTTPTTAYRTKRVSQERAGALAGLQGPGMCGVMSGSVTAC
jgi:hypothetical protein